MPFTLSHAVVALPFRRTVLIPSAIAIGAMVPDVPLFFPIRPVADAYWATHSWWGVITIDFALAALLFAVWRILLRPAVTALSPGWLRGRLPEGWDRAQRAVVKTRTIVLVACSLVMGSATHVFWDLFTHPARAGAEWLPALAEMWGPLPGYDWAQYASSVAGLLILVIWAVVTLRTRPLCLRRSRMSPPLVVITWIVAVVLPFGIAATDVWIHGPSTSISGLVFRIGVPAMACEFIFLLAVSLLHFLLEIRASGMTTERHARDAQKFAPSPPRT